MSISSRLDNSGVTNQQGAALFISLIILIVITIIGMASIQTTTLQQRMAGNFRLSNIAFQGAEAALVDAESRLELQGTSRKRPYTTTIDDQNPKGGKRKLNVWKKDSPAAGQTAWWRIVDSQWWNASKKHNSAYASNLPMDGLAERPLFVIESWGTSPPAKDYSWEDQTRIQDYADFHRITSRAVAGNNEAFILLQSTHKWEFDR